ncbi:MAG: acyltransferase [Chloroflexi bacterium]|nr:acyltransferase [Chloroflexota bacterium]
MKLFLINKVYAFVDKILSPTIKWILEGKIYSVLQMLQSGWRYSLWKARLGDLGRFSVIHPQVVIRAPEHVHIGRNVAIAEFVHMRGYGGIYIGDYSIIAAHASITSVTHSASIAGANFRDTNVVKPVIIEKNVWIGLNAIILPGVTIGEGSIVGAGSVVTHDVPPGVIVIGAPARILRHLGE